MWFVTSVGFNQHFFYLSALVSNLPALSTHTFLGVNALSVTVSIGMILFCTLPGIDNTETTITARSISGIFAPDTHTRTHTHGGVTTVR